MKKILIITLSLISLGGLLTALYFSRTKVPTNNDTLESEDEVFIEEEGSLVDGFPALPVYPSFTIDESSKEIDDGKTSWQAKWTSSDTTLKLSQITNWYSQQMPQSGWIISIPFEIQDNNPDSQTAVFEKDGLPLYLNVTRTEVKITLSVQTY